MIEPLRAGRPRHIGPYRLLGLLGAGGMGEVYLARRRDVPEGRLPVDKAPEDLEDKAPEGGPPDPRLHQVPEAAGLVALKTVRADLDLDDGFRTRFRREIDAAGAVRSPHTAALVGGDASGRAPWLATEYVPGPSLAEAVSRTGPLPEPVVRAAGAGLARALADMHAVRVLHRDLKPGNVLLGPDGPKVIDFGIAQAFDATQLTRTGVVVGSPGYISPEHVNGSRALVPASDVFCLGAVLAFAASGRGPFDDPDMAAVIFRIAHGEPELSGVPDGLREVVLRCLRARAQDRPAPAELAALLLPARPPTTSFPWPPGVREQQAGYERAARARLDEAGPDDAGPDEAPVAPPVPPSTPPRAPNLPAPIPSASPPVEGPRRNRIRRRTALAAGAVAVCVLLGHLVWPSLFPQEKEKGAGGAPTGPSSPGKASPAAERSTLRAIPGADSGSTGDFGKAAADITLQPVGWKAWAKKIDGVTTGCSLAESTLLCAGSDGVTALDALDGSPRWQTPKGQTGGAAASVAGLTTGTVYAFVGRALVAYRITDGREQWRTPLPASSTGTVSVQDGDTLFYATRAGQGDGGKLTARRLTGDRGEVWSKDLDTTATALRADDGRLVVAGGATLLVDAATGNVERRLVAAEFPCHDPVLKGRHLICRAETGVLVLDDVARPGTPRAMAQDVTLTHPPALAGDDTVLVSDDDHAYAFSLADGHRKWTGEPLLDDSGGAVSVAGDQALVASESAINSYGLGDGERGNSARSNAGPDPSDAHPVGLLAVGGLLYVTFDDGWVTSVNGP